MNNKNFIQGCVETSVWETDNQVGRQAARKCVRHMRDTNNPILLLREVRGMINDGRYGAIEIGFLTEVAINLIR